ncbi:hypothetical protein CHX27_01005 [Flavobacterium aurantiibacter]|uniref:Uncharacterized protein n=1 Tax=Flavobacterium aurantiibacter TaxID=2023067 RepID=A0A256AA67_9FLAO|nr:hypothetical protein CHX27_01005 [Flavobacterium aurantiibacter]
MENKTKNSNAVISKYFFFIIFGVNNYFDFISLLKTTLQISFQSYDFQTKGSGLSFKFGRSDKSCLLFDCFTLFTYLKNRFPFFDFRFFLICKSY